MSEKVPKPLVYSEGSLSSRESDSITFIHSHPSHNILAVGDTSGHIHMSVVDHVWLHVCWTFTWFSLIRYGYNPDEECQLEKSFSVSPGYSCRVLNFTSDGKSNRWYLSVFLHYIAIMYIYLIMCFCVLTLYCQSYSQAQRKASYLW